MNDINVFAIGLFVIILVGIGIVHTIREFRRIDKGRKKE
jgi:hypothetical protein